MKIPKTSLQVQRDCFMHTSLTFGNCYLKGSENRVFLPGSSSCRKNQLCMLPWMLRKQNKTKQLGNTWYEQFCLTNIQPWTEMVCFLLMHYREHRVTLRTGVIRCTLKLNNIQHKEQLLYIAKQYQRDVCTLTCHNIQVAQTLRERNQHQNAASE